MWEIKYKDRLREDQIEELDKLLKGLQSTGAEFLFGDVCDDQTFTIGLNLGCNLRVRITAYSGDFNPYYLSFFSGDDIIRQEYLDLENTIKGIKACKQIIDGYQ